MIPRCVQTIFCDDIRQEVSGKISYIGVYAKELYVNRFPAILPKLCLDIKVITPSDKPADSFVLYILKDEDVLQEITLTEEDIANGFNLSEHNNKLPEELEKIALVTGVQIIFSPLQLDEPCRLRVKVRINGEDIFGLGLIVAQLPLQE